MLKVEDEYTAYCLDSAADYLLNCLKQGNKPQYLVQLDEEQKIREHDESMRRAIAEIKRREGK